MSGFYVTGKDGVSRPLVRENATGQNNSPWTQSVSQTWSVNSNNPGQVHYNQTITQTRQFYTTLEEYQDYQRRVNEWLAYQWQLTYPQRKPSLAKRVMSTLGRNISAAIKSLG